MTRRPTPSTLALLLSAAPAAAGLPEGQPPVPVIGGPFVAECSGHYTTIHLDGGASYDPDGTPVTFEWYEECEHGWFEETNGAEAVFVMETDPCGHECSHLELRVTSGGDTVHERFTVAVEDTTAPVLEVPPDQVAVWGVSMSPAAMGMATASDACGGEAVLNWVDHRGAGEPCSGIEEIVEREWFASDACGNFSQGIQRIVLLSPSGGCSGTPPTNLELDPRVCENELDPSHKRGLFRANLLGRDAFDVTGVLPHSVRLFRLDEPARSVFPIRPGRTPIGDWVRASAFEFSACSPRGRDQSLDLSFRFRRRQVIEGLGLDDLEHGQRVTLVLAGRTESGNLFWAADDLTIAPEPTRFAAPPDRSISPWGPRGIR